MEQKRKYLELVEDAFTQAHVMKGDSQIPYVGLLKDNTSDVMYNSPALELKDSDDIRQYLVIGQTVNATVNRSLTKGMFNSLCLPFDIPLDKGLFNNTVAYYLYDVEYDPDAKSLHLVFKKEKRKLTAGVPYLVIPSDNIQAPLVFNNVTIKATEPSSISINGVDCVGIFCPELFVKDDTSKLFIAANNRLVYANSTAYINGMRIYFQLNVDVYYSNITTENCD